MAIDKKRTYQRFHIELSARYKAFNLASAPFEITVINIGPEGLCFLSKKLLHIGEAVELQVNLDGKTQITFKAQAIWVTEFSTGLYKIGVKVIDSASEDQTTFLKYYCAKLTLLIEDAQNNPAKNQNS